MAVGILGVKSAYTTVSQQLSLVRPKPVYDFNTVVGFASVLSQSASYPTISPPDGSWLSLGTRSISAQRTLALFVKYITEAEWEPGTYDFSTNGALGISYIFSGMVLVLANASPVVIEYSDVPYTIDNTTVRAGGVQVQEPGTLVIYAAGTHQKFTAAPAGWTARVVNLGDEAKTSWAYLATRRYADPGATGDADATIAAKTTVKHAFLVGIRPRPLPPTVPVVSAPADGAVSALGRVIDLTAQARDPKAGNVRYDWEVKLESGTTYVLQSGWVPSGQPTTVSWNPGAATGPVSLTCRAYNTGLSPSGTRSVGITLADALVTAPSDGGAHVAGKVRFSGRGYLPVAGQVSLQWEIDTNNPPDAGSPDYRLLTGPLVDQGVETTVTAECSTIWVRFYRVRTVDAQQQTRAWSPIRTLFILEGLRLLAGSTVEPSILSASNKVTVKVDKADPPIVVSAVHNEGPLAYSVTPREVCIIAPEGTDEAGASDIAGRRLQRCITEQTGYLNLKVSVYDGLRLKRGRRVRLQIGRAGVDVTSTVRRLVFDIAADECEVTLGDFWSPQDRWEAIVEVFRKLQAQEKEGA